MGHPLKKPAPSMQSDPYQASGTPDSAANKSRAYTVYLFPEKKEDNAATSWERGAQTCSRREALASAQDYFETARYECVEVQEKIFSERLKKPQIRVVKRLYQAPASRYENGLKIALAVIAALAAFGFSMALMMATARL